MAYEQKDNSGSLFVNNEKASEKHPDFRGRAMIGGENYFVSVWQKKSQKGTEWMSLSFTKETDAKAKGVKQANKALETNADNFDDFGDDSIPF
jgi:uncharacterized protein (DUF736 family)